MNEAEAQLVAARLVEALGARPERPMSKVTVAVPRA